MWTREKLQSYQQWLIRADDTYKTWERLKERKEQLGSGSDGLPRSSSMRAFDSAVIKTDAAAQRYWEHHVEALTARDEIEQFIKNLDKPIRKNIFTLKYIKGMTSQEVGDKVGYSRVEVERTISKVLNEHNVNSLHMVTH